MAEIFGNNDKLRGCFVSLNKIYNGSSRGAQLIMPSGRSLPTDDYTDPMLVVGFDCQLSETLLFNKCFGGRTYSYAFGHDPNASTVSVNLLGFLMKSSGASTVTDIVVDSYKKNRVSEQGKAAYLMVGSSKPLRGFVIGMSTQSIDPQYSLQSFTITLAVASL